MDRGYVPKRRFTTEEDSDIVALVDKFGDHAWSTIALHFSNRTPRQCRQRYRHYLQPGIEHLPWTQEEDLQLLRVYERLGPKWCAMREFLPGRSDVAVKNRWILISRRPEMIATTVLPQASRVSPSPPMPIVPILESGLRVVPNRFFRCFDREQTCRNDSSPPG
jgi:hypothetical protein